ncbi:MAG: cyclodeaminase/cyclohydrolase family protein [Haloarculaceae archaeon]
MTVADLAIGEFLDGVASQAVTPSGGAVAAVCGASGAALCEMACVHTLAGEVGDGSAHLDDVGAELAALRERLLESADEDVAAVDDLQAALASADSPSADAVQDAAEDATESPIRIAEASLAVLDHATVVTEAASPTAVPDAGTGASLAHGSLRAMVWTARSNLGLLEDSGVVADFEERIADVESAGDSALGEVGENVRQVR